jgi:hypothetical protein
MIVELALMLMMVNGERNLHGCLSRLTTVRVFLSYRRKDGVREPCCVCVCVCVGVGMCMCIYVCNFNF